MPTALWICAETDQCRRTFQSTERCHTLPLVHTPSPLSARCSDVAAGDETTLPSRDSSPPCDSKQPQSPLILQTPASCQLLSAAGQLQRTTEQLFTALSAAAACVSSSKLRNRVSYTKHIRPIGVISNISRMRATTAVFKWSKSKSTQHRAYMCTQQTIISVNHSRNGRSDIYMNAQITKLMVTRLQPKHDVSLA